MSTSRVTATIADWLSSVSEAEPVAGRDESWALVAAAREGDRDAFGRLVDLHESAALRTAMAALGRREDAEDAVQDAFVLAWRRLPGFRGDASFRTWLLAIVWRRSLDRRKVRERWWRRNPSWSALPEEAERLVPTGHANTPEQSALDDEFRATCADAIRRLSPKLRDALLLAASGEHTYDDIARLQGIRVGTVKWRVFEARRIVRAAIDRAKN